MRSSSGKRLAGEDALEVMRKKLLPLCTVVTPNIDEASLLTGIAVRKRKDMEEAAMRVKEYGCGVVIITGGHFEKIAMDLFFDGTFHYLRSGKISGEFHGTGCAFSSAVAAALAKGKTALDAAKTAKRFMNRSLTRSFGTGVRMRLLDI
jgi:hydroxymethylpyrimidine kinase/phosphomethylpyrimidine kinase